MKHLRATASQRSQLVLQKSFIVDFPLGSKYAFYMQCWPIHLFILDIIFYRKKISKQAIEIWILISIIPQNILTLHAKKSTLNMTENYHREKKYSVGWSGMSLTCPDLYKAHFSNFLSHFFDITKMGNWWNSTFLKV